MKKLSLLVMLFSLNLVFAQSSLPNIPFERYSPENIKQWIDAGNDPNTIIGEGAGSKYCVFWAFTNRLGLYCDSTYTESIFYMLEKSKFPIDDVLYFITDPCDVGIVILQYLRLALENKHQYNPTELEYIGYFIRAKDTDYGKANLNTKDAFGNVLIVLAAEFQLEPLFEIAMKLKANVNKADNNGMTALHFAIKNGNSDMIKALMKAEANILITNNVGDTPLILAAKNHDWKTAKTLVIMGANTKTKNKAGEKAANFAGSKIAKKALKGK